MKNYISILIFTTYLITCFSCSQEDTKENITSLVYKLDIEVISDTINPAVSEYLLQKHGDSLIMSINGEGSIRFDFIGSGKNGYDFNLFDINTNQYYGKWKHIDTLYYYDVSHNILKLVERKSLDNQIVNSINCQVLEFKGVDEEHPSYYVNQTFYFNSDTLEVKSEKYRRYKEFFFDEYLLASNSFYVKKVIEMPEYRLTYTLINNYKNRSMKQTEFNPPKNIPLKEM